MDEEEGELEGVEEDKWGVSQALRGKLAAEQRTFSAEQRTMAAAEPERRQSGEVPEAFQELFRMQY